MNPAGKVTRYGYDIDLHRYCTTDPPVNVTSYINGYYRNRLNQTVTKKNATEAGGIMLSPGW